MSVNRSDFASFEADRKFSLVSRAPRGRPLCSNGEVSTVHARYGRLCEESMVNSEGLKNVDKLLFQSREMKSHTVRFWFKAVLEV